METYTDAHNVPLHVGDYVRRLPQGIAGRVLGFDDESGRILVEWPYITIDVRECDIERITSPVLPPDELPILEIWRCGSDVPSPNTTYEVLGKWQDIDCEMWTCRIVSDDGSEEIADCFAAYIKMDATRLDEAIASNLTEARF